jgi:hypothetical protein
VVNDPDYLSDITGITQMMKEAELDDAACLDELEEF